MMNYVECLSCSSTFKTSRVKRVGGASPRPDAHAYPCYHPDEDKYDYCPICGSGDLVAAIRDVRDCAMRMIEVFPGRSVTVETKSRPLYAHPLAITLTVDRYRNDTVWADSPDETLGDIFKRALTAATQRDTVQILKNQGAAGLKVYPPMPD